MDSRWPLTRRMGKPFYSAAPRILVVRRFWQTHGYGMELPGPRRRRLQARWHACGVLWSMTLRVRHWFCSVARPATVSSRLETRGNGTAPTGHCKRHSPCPLPGTAMPWRMTRNIDRLSCSADRLLRAQISEIPGFGMEGTGVSRTVPQARQRERGRAWPMTVRAGGSFSSAGSARVLQPTHFMETPGRGMDLPGHNCFQWMHPQRAATWG